MDYIDAKEDKNYLEIVKEKVADYIAKEPVEETEEVISAYTLLSAVENCKKRLRHVEEIKKGLLDKVNEIYPKETKEVKKGLFKKKTISNHFKALDYEINRTSTNLHFWTSYSCAGGRDPKLAKDYMYSDIYSVGTGLTEEAYNACKDDIIILFRELDYFGSLYNRDEKASGYGVTNIISSDGFDLSVSFGKGIYDISFGYNVKLNDKIAPNGHADAYYYGKDNNIDKVINENIVTILKNTPVNISDLSYMFCMIVLDYRKMTEKNKIDEEIDKAFQKLYTKK